MRIKISSAKKVKGSLNSLPLRSSEPRSGFRENKQYEKDLRAGLDSTDVRTIALAGVYGSGKSSILRSVKRKNFGKRKARAVSLLGFSDNGISDQDLQTAIIKQLHDSARKRWIRGSRYSRVERQRSAGAALFLVCWILCGFLLHKQLFDFVLACIVNLLDISYLDTYDSLLIGVPFTVLACFIIAVIISLIAYYLLPYTKVTEISLFGCSIEMTPAAPNFSNSTDEIINILERARIGVLIFEDLDRFNQPQIYEQLYNLCTTINEYMRNNHPLRYREYRVVFIFALRDDLLPNAKARTKLFDLYIPVNNPVSPNNAYETVENAFSSYLTTYVSAKKDKTARKQAEAALAVIAKSTTDIRTINAIYNSAQTLKRSFMDQRVEWPEDDKIIIAATRRQLFPKEYALEVDGKGFLDIAYEKCVKKRNGEFEKIREMSYQAEELIAQLESAIRKDLLDMYQISDVGSLSYITISDNDIPCSKNRTEYWRRIVNSGAREVTFVFQSRYSNDVSGSYTASRLKDLGPYDALSEVILHSPEMARAKDKTEKTMGDALKLYYNEVCEEALTEYAKAQSIDDEGKPSAEIMADWMGQQIQKGLLDSSYPCYVSPIVRRGESEQLTAFRLYNLTRGLADYITPFLEGSDIAKLIDSMNPVEVSSVALLNVHIIWYILSQRRNLELVSEIFDWQADHVERLAEFFEMFYAWAIVGLGDPADSHYSKTCHILSQVTALLAEKCRERVLATIANNWALTPDGLGQDLVATALTARNEPLHLITGSPSANDILDLLDSSANNVIRKGGGSVADQLVQTFVQYGYTIKNGSAFTQYPDRLQVLIENGLLSPTTSNLEYIPANQRIEYLEKNLGTLSTNDAQELFSMLRDGGIDLTNELVMRFTKMLPREAGIELIASSNLEGEMLREAVKNLDERFERLCDGRCTVQFDHKTDDLMKLLRKLKDAGIITRYWFDKKTSKLNASSSFRAIDSQG